MRGRFEGDWRDRNRSRRHAQLSTHWPNLITVVGLGVALPITVGIPDTDTPFGAYGDEVAVVIAMIAAIGGLFLALAAVAGHRRREVVLAGAALAIALAHPGIEFVPGELGDNPFGHGRTALAAAAAAVAAFYGTEGRRPGSPLRLITIALATVALGLSISTEFGADAHLAPAAAMALAIACTLGGVLAHLRGAREADGGLIAVGILTGSAGLSTALNLVGGRTDLTIGVATLTMISVVLGAIAAFMAFLDALERHDLGRDTQRLARSLELARLTAQSERHAELAHDQRTALLAIEAAALRLRDHPSGGLADAVATEAQRLQRMLDGGTDARAMFAVDEVVSPVVTCLSSLYGPIHVDYEALRPAYGHIDETAEIIRALIENAHEHGQMPISVRVQGSEHAVTVSVSDAGAGVPEALRGVVFDRGVTTDPTTHSGLGLFSARRLALLDGGDLRIAPGDTTTFELRLPARPPDHLVIDLDAVPETTADTRSMNG